MPHIKNPVQRQQQQNGLSYGQLMTLPEVQASNAPFPPGSKVYILNNLLEPSSIICSGEVVEILVKIEMSADKSALELIYKVRDENGLHALSRNNGQGDNSDNEEQSINFFFVNEKQIRFQNGCPVYLASVEERNNESKEGIILGLCDVPRRLRSETTPYWYSIMLLADGKCEHEVTSHRVRYRHTTNDAASTDAAPLSGNIQQNVNDAIVIKDEQDEDEMSHSAEIHEEVDGIMENILKKRKDIESDETTNTNTCTSTTQRNETPEQSITERLSGNESHDAGVECDILQENDTSRKESSYSQATTDKMSSSETDKQASPCKKSQFLDQNTMGSSSSNEVVQRGPSEERNDLSDTKELVDEPHKLNTEESSGWFSSSACRRFSDDQEPSPQHNITRQQINEESTTSRGSKSSSLSRPMKKARFSEDPPTTDNANPSPDCPRRSESKYAYGCEIEFPLPAGLVIDILIGQNGGILEYFENRCNSSIKEERVTRRPNLLRHIFCIEGHTAEAVTHTISRMIDRLKSRLPSNWLKALTNRMLRPKGMYVLSDSEKELQTVYRERPNDPKEQSIITGLSSDTAQYGHTSWRESTQFITSKEKRRTSDNYKSASSREKSQLDKYEIGSGSSNEQKKSSCIKSVDNPHNSQRGKAAVWLPPSECQRQSTRQINEELATSRRSTSSPSSLLGPKKNAKLSDDPPPTDNTNISPCTPPRKSQRNYPYGCEVEFQLPSQILIGIIIGQQGNVLDSLEKECDSVITEKRSLRDRDNKIRHIFCIEGNTAHAVSFTKSCMIQRLESELPPALLNSLKYTTFLPKGKFVLNSVQEEQSQIPLPPSTPQLSHRKTGDDGTPRQTRKQRHITRASTIVFNRKGELGSYLGFISFSSWAREYLPGDDVMENIMKRIEKETRCEASFQFRGNAIQFKSRSESQAQDARDRAESMLLEYFNDEDKTRAIVDFCSARKGVNHIGNFDDIVFSHSWPQTAHRVLQSICVRSSTESFFPLMQSPSVVERIRKSTGCKILQITSPGEPYFILRSEESNIIRNAIEAIEKEALRRDRR